MKEIELGKQGSKHKGQFVALVDDEDFEYLNNFNWHAWKSGNVWYAIRKEKYPYRFILMHRVILNTPIGTQVDHADRNGLNNQKNNIRNCNSTENQHNKVGWSKSGFKGVYLVKYKTNPIRYRACIQINNKFIHLGYYNTAEEAAKEYDRVALLHFGSFARTNY